MRERYEFGDREPQNAKVFGCEHSEIAKRDVGDDAASFFDDDGCAGAACFGTTFLATAAACGGGAVMALLLGVRSRKRYAIAEPPESLLAAARAGETVV